MRVRGSYINLNLPDVEEMQYVDRVFGSRWKFGELPYCSGVYFFLDGRDVVYVGESANLCARVKGHHKLNNNVTRIAFLPLKDGDDKERHLLEKAYILGYKPRLNKEIE